MSEDCLSRIKVFNGENFSLWKFQFRLLLEQQKLLELLEGLEIKPNVVSSDSNSESSLQNWKSKDVKARMLLSQAIELKFLQPLMNCTSASQMWQKLLAIHEQKSEFTIGLLWQQFFDARLTSETISDYIAKIENISAQISQMGGTITEDQKVAKILNTLPSSMRYFVAAWESLDPKAQTLNNLTARLLIEETRNQQSGSSKQDEALLHRQARTKPKDTQRSFQDAKKNTKCHYCHKIGHWSRECRKSLANEKNKSKNLHDSKGSSSDYGLILCDNQVEPNDIWYADSGASCSMTFRREWFKTYTPFTSDHPIYLGDNSTLLAEGMGDIEIQAYVDGGWYNTYIRNVLYSPQLKKNLYSLSTSTRRGFNVIIKHDKLQIFMDNDLKAVGVRHDDLYRMLFKVTSSSQGYITSENKLQLWHERLAHLPVARLREMATKGLVDGLQPQDLEGEFFFCEGCQLGKAHRKSCYPSDGKNYQLGEFIYADICGPMQTQSLSKYLYFCLFKDYFSGYRHIYFIKNKSDVLDIFKEYATLIYTQTGNKIKVLRTDNALEFKSDNFADLCKRFGIIHEFTAPYVHEQIGRIERDNRTIVEAARSMLNSRNLPGFFWAEACNTATYILNRSATKQTPGTTPYELFFGTKPNVANYKIFGCNAYMHIPKENRKKWDNKSIKLMFLGYENTSKNFRLWDWKTRKIRISKDVTFDEKATPHSDRESTKPKEIIFQINSAPDESPVATTNFPVQEMLPVSDISSHPMITRSKVSDSQCNFALADEPSNYIDAITSSDSERWKLAMDEEIDALNKNKTWTLERLADGHKPIGCKWVYKIKTESDGTIQRFKARLVAKGYSQIKNVDYFDTFSPVVRYDSLRILLSHAASERMFLKQFYVKTAFLNGELEELVYLEQPEGYKRDDNSCYRLHKSLYGLRQSSRNWNKKFTNFLYSHNFKTSDADPCIFIGTHNDSNVILALYVDDGIILSKDKEAIAIIMDELEHAFDITSGSVNFFVGLQIEQSEDRAKQKEKMPKFPFREAVGSLMFASCVSRPDITYAVSQVSEFLEYPGPAHCTTVKNIFRYLKGTPHMGILFTGQDQLVGYSDSDFARDVDSRKSTTGYAFMMNGGTVSWASQRQPIIALSTTESKYIAACSAAKELIWIRRLLQGIGCDITKETELYIDNQAAIKLVENPVFHKRTKHIDVRYHFIRSKHKEGELKVHHVCSSEQLADIMTKPLPRNKFHYLRGLLNILDREGVDKNDEAFGIIITTLTNEQAGMFIGETNAKKVWDSLRKTYTGNLEDKIIDIGLELKNIKMKDNETVDEYITRAKNIAARSSSLGHQFPSRELSFHIVRGIHPRYENIAIVLRSKREATIEEIQQTLREEESRRNMRLNQSVENGHEQAYRIKNRKVKQFQPKSCFVCNKKGHLANDCWFRDKQKQGYQKKWTPDYRNHRYSREHSNNLMDTMKRVSKYFFVIVDDYSRRIFVYFLRSKDETFERFEEFKARAENELSLRIKDVRTDNGTEFCNSRFEGPFKRSGIHHQLTKTYSPQSNGVAERVNRTLIDTARTLLIDSKLPMMFWAEAIATAAYIKNCTPHRSIKHHTPMQRWNGRKPSVKHIRIFGCLTHWLESKPRRSKFSPKGRKGIFIGYSIKGKAYRIYDIMTKRIHEVRSEYTNGDNLTYKGNCEEIVEDFLSLKEDNPVTESEMKSQEDTSAKPGGDTENDSTQTEPIEERCAKGGRKKGETKSILEERHKARLEEQERKLIGEGVRRSQRIKERNDANLIMEIDHYIPDNFKEAMDSGERNEWHKAMEEELSEIYGTLHDFACHTCAGAMLIFMTAKAAINWIQSDKITSRTKHINRKYYFVKEEIQNGIKLEYTKSEDMEADILTKSLPKDKLRKCADSLGLAD
ncbi:hypothetical protein LAZ67_X004795 [Cordylochernes scorpioides]|uniref:Uncharacterized protein n=1 Tax=Cordylochernes scorpioides TaxID=51811 RepID=A0ABY6LVA5_9ARAC|nr:hypothetical protein LAZ67_X004795 [Cordylochernes scorpioides]